jgi:hypothetical protein
MSLSKIDKRKQGFFPVPERTAYLKQLEILKIAVSHTLKVSVVGFGAWA